MTAKSRWSQLHGKRSGVLERARQCADLTIPALLPPEGTKENDNLPTPYQSLGARGVNHLASKLMLTLFPSSTSFFRFKVDEAVLDELSQIEGARTAVDETMRQVEQRGMQKLEVGNIRSILHTCLKQLIVVGDALLHKPKSGESRMYRLDQFCIVRDPRGRVLEIVIREMAHPSSFSEEHREATGITKQEDLEADVELYTHVARADGDRFEWFQEVNGVKLPGTEGRAKVENSPYIPLRWSDGGGEDYGRSMVEDYLGDLRSLEGLSKAILQFSAIAAKIIFLANPNSTLDISELAKAASGEVIVGNREDIGILQLEKYADFQVAKGVIDELNLRLSHAFLLPSGTVRDAERVTAEEIRAMAQELEDVLGGVYSTLAQELQLPLVRSIVRDLKAEGAYPKIPAKNGRPAISPAIVTGFDALGRGHELNRYRAFVADVVNTFGVEVAQQYLNVSTGLQKFATGHNIDAGELVKSEEQVAQERQQAQQLAMQQQLATEVAAPAAQAVGKAVTGN